MNKTGLLFLRRGLRALGWILFGAWLLFAALVLGLRYVILPQVDSWRPQIEAAASRAVGLPVRIGKIEARWQGLNPDLVLDDVVIADRQGQPALVLNRVESVLSWQSLWRGRPQLALLAFAGPVLQVRRDGAGRITVAGFSAEGESDPAFTHWLLEQRRIRIRDATVVWEDQLRGAPPLILEDLQFALDNRGGRHAFGLSAMPPEALAARLEVRGEVHGELQGEPHGDVGANLGAMLDRYAGQLFVELAYADLAGWQPWLDYPVQLPAGRGALRLWGDLRDGKGDVTADVALEDVRLRLGRQLPELDLTVLRGRLQASYAAAAWSVAGRAVELQTRDGVRIAPTDFRLEWLQAPGSAAVDGTASASFLDVALLGQLAAYLPLDADSRALLMTHRPQGQISELLASWSVAGESLDRYALKANFRELGLRPGGYFPGASGLSGRLDCTERGGELVLDSGPSGLALPAVFPEPDIAFDQLQGRIDWRREGGGLDIRLDKLIFAGADAAGSARGRYRYTGQGPGEIDLEAWVDRADGRAVWRYMPHAVNADARAWLRRGIVQGRAHDAHLILKGDLRDFPFRKPASGIFSVTAKASETRIDFAPGWPLIEGIEADMRFGSGMLVQASRGRIMGASIGPVSVRIPDFEAREEMLLVRGQAQGPTGEFLRFIEQSPVNRMIDQFTEGMKANGNGRLDLELDIPLRHPDDTRLRGQYVFQNNQLQPIALLPPITQVSGRLAISERSVSARDITGRAFGGPLNVQVDRAGDKVAVQASGRARIAEVSRHFGWPLLDQLAGEADWRSDITIGQRQAQVVVSSDLLGISSPLPEPLNKNASSALPLRIERSDADGERETYRITLGEVGRAQLVRREGRLERGAVALGGAELRPPERGLALRATLPFVDADAWRNYLPDSEGNGELNGEGKARNGATASGKKGEGKAAEGPSVGGKAGAKAEPEALGGFTLLSLKTPRLRLFGRDYHQVEGQLRPREDGWQIALNTSEAEGDVFWRGAGDGWVEGNFRRLFIRPAREAGDASNQIINRLPGMNLAVEDFRVGDKVLGKLALRARNERGAWHMEKLSLRNPDGSLEGKGVWNNVGQHRTQLDFALGANDIGRLLDRLGYADAVRRGSATLKGQLNWQGPLTDIHYASLNGEMRIDAAKGQFNKLEPGVGKLLGLISLQSLPRRLTLDFRDIFSDGLAFDSIEGELVVSHGIMRTRQPLRILGPAVQVEMRGETNLQRETQDLDVVVRPELGGLAAVGAAALVNPVAGAAALVANTVLQKPLNRLFSYRYHVTGTWSDPLVDQAGKTEETAPEAVPAPAAAPPSATPAPVLRPAGDKP